MVKQKINKQIVIWNEIQKHLLNKISLHRPVATINVCNKDVNMFYSVNELHIEVGEYYISIESGEFILEFDLDNILTVETNDNDEFIEYHFICTGSDIYICIFK